MSKKPSKTIFNAFIFYAVIIICSFSFNSPVLAQEWIWNDLNLTNGKTIYDIVYANGLYVAVGSDGIILTSEDAAIWNPIDPITAENLRSIAYGLGKFYVVGYNGAILSSENGADWSIVSTEITGDFYSVAYNGSSRLVAVGQVYDGAGALVAFAAVSDDGETWTEYQLPTIATGLSGITYGNGRYVAVGFKRKVIGKDPIIATSLNGVNWSKQIPLAGAGALEDVAYGNGKYVAVGALNNQILFSQDASLWLAYDAAEISGIWYAATYAEELFVIAGPQVLSSPDGQNWTLRRDNQAENTWLNGIGYGDGSVVAVGYGGWNGLVRAPDVMVSSRGYLPDLEREALIALYNRTDGDNWTDHSGWKEPPLHTDGFAMPGTEGTWYGIVCDFMNTSVQEINLSSNGLTDNGVDDSIPAELKNLDSLQVLDLSSNQMTGSIHPDLGALNNLQVLDLSSNQLELIIPTQLGGIDNLQVLDLSSNQLLGDIPTGLSVLSNLQHLDLSSNQLSGSIPGELGNLANLQRLYLDSNSLTGSIPPELGTLGNLEYLYLNGNKLRGEISTSLNNLTLLSTTHTDIGYNALYSHNGTVRTFLNTKDPDWEETQTIAPEDVSAVTLSDTSARVSWTPILYTGDSGKYRVYYSETSGGPYTVFGATTDKTISQMDVTGLESGVLYYFVVQSHTDPHPNNQNTVDSYYSEEASADADGDGIPDNIEDGSCTDSNDADSDDDGLTDGEEDANRNGVVDTYETNPCNADSDGDGIQDGTELGVTTGHPTDTGGAFIPDADGGATTTDPLDPDTDDDSLSDGEEDSNFNGAVDPGETDPNDPNPSSPPPAADITSWIFIVLDD